MQPVTHPERPQLVPLANTANRRILALECGKFPQTVHGKRMRYVKGCRPSLAIDVVSVINGRQQAVASRRRGIHDAGGLADRKCRLQCKGLTEAMEDGERRSIIMRPSTVIPETNRIKEGIWPDGGT